MAPKKKPAHNQIMFTANDLASLISRASRLDPTNPDPRRNLDAECGYPDNPDSKYFIEMFKTDGLARRAVSIYPNECFGVQPQVYEHEGPKLTEMEKDWKALLDDPYTNPIHFMHQADLESRKGRFSVILMGFDDGKDLSLPVEGVDENDLPVPLNGKRSRCLYLRAFNESNVYIKASEGRKTCRRYGRPTVYNVRLVNEYSSEQGITKVATTTDQEVHWTRIIHVAEGGEVFADPCLEPIYRPILDTRKIGGSSAEMFYKGGFAPMTLEMDPRILELKELAINLESLQSDVQKWLNGLQRVLTLVGFTAKSLAPQVASPEPHLAAQLQLICLSLGVPMRIFLGSEAGQLASAQDVKNWNRRLKLRQEGYIQNYILRPLVNRLINVGAVAQPRKGPTQYYVYWPDVNIPDDNEQSQIADRLAAALMKYMMSGAFKIMKVATFFRVILRIPAKEVEAMMDELKQNDGIDYDKLLLLLGKGPADSGGGRPPSDPEKGGKTH